MTDVKQLITEHLDIWLTAETEKKSGRGRSSGSNDSIYGVQKLRELILDLAISGSLVKTHSTVQFEQEFFSLNKSNSKKIDTSVIKEKLNDTIFKIPSSWAWETLGNLFYFENGDRGKNYPNKDCLVEIGIPFVNAGHLKNDSIDIHEMTFITQDKFDTLNSGKFKEGDILYCLRGSLGKYAVVQKDLKGAIASSLVILRAYENSFIDYISLFLQSNFAKKQIKIYDNGTAQPNLSSADLRKFLVPMPSKEERSQIVEKVDELMQLCDQLEQQQTLSSDAHATLVDTLLKALTESSDADEFQDNWQRIVANFDVLFTTEYSIEQLKQTVLQLAVMGKLVKQEPMDESIKLEIKTHKSKFSKKNSEPNYINFSGLDELKNSFVSGIEIFRLGDIADIVRGGSPRPAGDLRFYEGNIPFLKVADITRSKGKFVEGYTSTIKEAGLHKTRFIDSRTVLLTNSGATLGVPAICDFPTTFNDGVAAFINLSNHVFDEYLYLYLSTLTKWFLNIAAQGQGQPNLNTDIIKSTWMAIPTIKIQKDIVQKVDQLFSIIDQLRTLQTKARQTQLHLADVLVANAVEGA